MARRRNCLKLDQILYIATGLAAFAALSLFSMKKRSTAPPVPPQDLATILNSKKTNSGFDLATLSRLSPVLVVFLRHAGCTFCRQTVRDVVVSKRRIESAGIRIVFVQLSDASASRQLFSTYGLEDPEYIQDSDQQLYSAFGLRRGGFSALASPKVIWSGLRAGLLEGHGIGFPEGDVLQLPGVFLLDDCEVVSSFRHKTAADRPDYQAIALSQSK